jgi:putative flavoprotein involved in K+ transport
MSMPGHWGTLVIGGGQAGLALGHHLARLGEEFAILDAEARIGDAWRQRWDSLRLFTPAQYDGLPGMPFPAPRGSLPTKDEMAAYLEAYARKFALPVRSGERVRELLRTKQGFEVRCSHGTFTADRIVLATGTHPVPRLPEFARDLSPAVHQLHSSQYRGPESLPAGDVLVVGAGTSGVELAIELAPSRPTFVAGTPTVHIPGAVFRYAGGLYWLLISHLLTVRTPLGRKARPSILKGGAPLIRVSEADLVAAGAQRVPRVAGIGDGGLPRLADGRTLQVSSVIWATGYRPDFSWVRFPITDEDGWPTGYRGVSSLVPDLYFVGMPFQFGLTSGLVGGVGRDAAYVAGEIHRHASRRRVGAVSTGRAPAEQD